MTTIFDSTALAQKYLEALAPQVEALSAWRGRSPCLAVVQSASDTGAQAYTRRILALAERAGVRGVVHVAERSEEAFCDQVRLLGEASEVDGILIQFPLPEGIRRERVLAALSPERDVDCLTAVNLGWIMAGHPVYLPCTATGALLLAEHLAGDLRGKNCVVIGASTVVGRPLAMGLLDRGATVEVVHIDTQDIASHCRRAGIVFAAAGHASLVRRNWIAPGAILIDIGVNFSPVTQGLVGDILLEDALGVAEVLTAVPNGVGPLTTSILIANTIQSAGRCVGMPFSYPDLATL